MWQNPLEELAWVPYLAIAASKGVDDLWLVRWIETNLRLNKTVAKRNASAFALIVRRVRRAHLHRNSFVLMMERP